MCHSHVRVDSTSLQLQRLFFTRGGAAVVSLDGVVDGNDATLGTAAVDDANDADPGTLTVGVADADAADVDDAGP